MKYRAHNKERDASAKAGLAAALPEPAGPLFGPATMTYREDGIPVNTLCNDIFSAYRGSPGRTRHVFLAGNGLPARWRGRRQFTILETGFGAGWHFLLTWLAWRQDGAQASTHLHYVSLEPQPLRAEDLTRTLAWHLAHSPNDRDALAPLVAALQTAWPTLLVSGLHRFVFDDGRVTLTVGFGDALTLAGKLRLRADAFYLDGFAPALNPALIPALYPAPSPAPDPAIMQSGLVRAMARLADESARVATDTGSEHVRLDLAAAGFHLEQLAGFEGGPPMTAGGFAPRWQVRRRAPPLPALPPATTGPDKNDASSSANRHAIVIGGGVAGCALMSALARRGWRVTVIEGGETLASGASGNPAGLFHPIITRDEGLAARWSRAAFLHALREWHRLDLAGRRPASAGTHLIWSHEGLVQRDVDDLDAAEASPDVESADGGEAADAVIAGGAAVGAGLPAEIVERLDRARVAERCGAPIDAEGWWFRTGGWIDPRSLCRCWHDDAVSSAARVADGRASVSEAAVSVRLRTRVDSLVRENDLWVVRDASGEVLARAEIVVLANACDAPRLAPVRYLPCEPVRGQLTILPHAGAVFGTNARPVIGGAYAIPGLPDRNALLTGASYRVGDTSTTPTDAEHDENLSRLARLTGLPAERFAPYASEREGRAAIRCVTSDRMPYIGQIADESEVFGILNGTRASAGKRAGPLRGAHPEDLPRLAGLYALFGLGSRGILWSALAAEVLASQLEGAPAPVEKDLLDAVDPARYFLRALRRGADA